MLFDVGIFGSSFAGSLLAWILAASGRKVVLLDRAQHPRFAIGESSTPLADLLLEKLADRYGLTALKSLSRWGRWQRDLPHLTAGKKRGFSYYAHCQGQAFCETPTHERSLLVSASASDGLSDTHWLRSDVDAWFLRQAENAGVVVLEQFQIADLQSHPGGWAVAGRQMGQTQQVSCRFVVDATGGGGLLASALQLPSQDHRLRTRNAALYGHFRHVGSMTDWQRSAGIDLQDDPFDGDAAAQHHMLECGWVWMLRFNNGTTSVGIVRPAASWSPAGNPASPTELWNALLTPYPTLIDLMRRAELSAPVQDGRPALGWLPRISRLWSQAAGEGWAMLPNTAGIVDPLHSTGIAHALSGVDRLAKILLSPPATLTQQQELAVYSRDLTQEVVWIDRLVHHCYAAAKHSFALFAAMTSLYFIAAIHSERDLAATGTLPRGFLLSRSEELQQVLQGVEAKLPDLSRSPTSAQAEQDWIAWLREQIAPWNDVGLLDPALNNRIARSAAPKADAKPDAEVVDGGWRDWRPSP